MYGGEDSLGPRLLGILAAAAAGYALQTWQKKEPGNVWPLVTDVLLIPAGAALANPRYRPGTIATGEALMNGAAFGLGTWAADATPTIGGVPAGVPQVWQPFLASSASGAARGRGGAGGVVARGGGGGGGRTPAAVGFGAYDVNFEVD